jgi:hypothetical protein
MFFFTCCLCDNHVGAARQTQQSWMVETVPNSFSLRAFRSRVPKRGQNKSGSIPTRQHFRGGNDAPMWKSKRMHRIGFF